MTPALPLTVFYCFQYHRSLFDKQLINNSNCSPLLISKYYLAKCTKCTISLWQASLIQFTLETLTSYNHRLENHKQVIDTLTVYTNHFFNARVGILPYIHCIYTMFSKCKCCLKQIQTCSHSKLIKLSSIQSLFCSLIPWCYHNNTKSSPNVFLSHRSTPIKHHLNLFTVILLLSAKFKGLASYYTMSC